MAITVSPEEIRKMREETGEGVIECRRVLRKKKALEALARLRWREVESDVIDILEYLVDMT